MEFKISELLDGLTEAEVSIRPNTRASTNRIKELTMKKIRSEKKQHRSLSGLTKVLLAAAILASLAIPVLAATGFHFTDWLEGLFQPGEDYHSSLTLGSESKNWEISGWVVELSAKDATAEGLTLSCTQWGNEAVRKSGSLNVDDSFWLETYQEGSYVKLPEQEISAGELVPVQADAVTEYPISWADSYGSLAPGSYRLGKNFTYISDDGKQETVPFYAKFRVFEQDMDAVVKEHQAMLENLRTSDSYHLQFASDYESDEYDILVIEVWKHGNDWLSEYRYVKEDGSLWRRMGHLYKDGKGYNLEWNGDSMTSPLLSWEHIDWLDDSNRDLWKWSFEIYDMSMGEIQGMENTTTFLMGSAEATGEVYYKVVTITDDGQGNLKEAYNGTTSDKEFTKESLNGLNTMEVFDTPVDEIAAIINAQNVTDPASFSWEEDQAKYPDAKTEGFVNTASKPIGNGEEAIARAKNECTLEYQNKATAAYDKEAEMWRVELGFSQDDTVGQTVYLTAEGITKLTVTK